MDADWFLLIRVIPRSSASHFFRFLLITDNCLLFTHYRHGRHILRVLVGGENATFGRGDFTITVAVCAIEKQLAELRDCLDVGTYVAHAVGGCNLQRCLLYLPTPG